MPRPDDWSHAAEPVRLEAPAEFIDRNLEEGAGGAAGAALFANLFAAMCV